MGSIPLTAADAVVLTIVIAVVALILRGMLRGTIRTCDSTSCSGECGSCGNQCKAPRIRLSRAQQAQLREIDRQAREA
jgi:NAD-dependent dihydropyrimidine dehydrogenase PreA subunit